MMAGVALCVIAVVLGAWLISRAICTARYSLGGKVAVPHMAPCSASKFALTDFSDAIRAELARDHIYVTTVAPGMMRTGSHVNARFNGKHDDEFAWFAASA